jgi:hypothetical protein
LSASSWSMLSDTMEPGVCGRDPVRVTAALRAVGTMLSPLLSQSRRQRSRCARTRPGLRRRPPAAQSARRLPAKRPCPPCPVAAAAPACWPHPRPCRSSSRPSLAGAPCASAAVRSPAHDSQGPSGAHPAVRPPVAPTAQR